jgi:hypothetical protein
MVLRRIGSRRQEVSRRAVVGRSDREIVLRAGLLSTAIDRREGESA